MGQIIDIGARSRSSVIAPVHALLDTLLRQGSSEQRLFILTDAQVLGSYDTFSGSIEELMNNFATTNMLGFNIGFGVGDFISVYPPKSFSSSLTTWRIIAEARESWAKSILEQIVMFSEIDYAALTQDDTLDLDDFDHVDKSNFPWSDWRLIAVQFGK